MSEKYNSRAGSLWSYKDSRYSDRREWHIFYLRPRTEKVICHTLTNLGYEVFCPVIQQIKTWKNRQRKKIRIPLFPNYMFVYTYPYELYTIRTFPQVVTYVSFAGKPSTLSSKEVEGIRRMLGLGKSICIGDKYSKGVRVRITSGPLKGHEGILVRQRNRSRFGIQLKAINHSVFIDISHSVLERL